MLALPLLAIGLALIPAESVGARDLLFGGLAGFGGMVGLVLFYGALARGTMSVVAPITGATSAIIPVVADLAGGARLSTTEVVGITVALAAVVLVSLERGPVRFDLRGATRAILAGMGFGLFFVALGETSEASGMWPLVAARAVSMPVALVVAVGSAGLVKPQRRDAGLVALAGNLDMGANIALAWALQRGSLAVGAVLSSLYPAVTAVTATIVLRERPASWQVSGIALAIAAMALLGL